MYSCWVLRQMSAKAGRASPCQTLWFHDSCSPSFCEWHHHPEDLNALLNALNTVMLAQGPQCVFYSVHTAGIGDANEQDLLSLIKASIKGTVIASLPSFSLIVRSFSRCFVALD